MKPLRILDLMCTVIMLAFIMGVAIVPMGCDAGRRITGAYAGPGGLIAVRADAAETLANDPAATAEELTAELGNCAALWQDMFNNNCPLICPIQLNAQFTDFLTTFTAESWADYEAANTQNPDMTDELMRRSLKRQAGRLRKFIRPVVPTGT